MSGGAQQRARDGCGGTDTHPVLICVGARARNKQPLNRGGVASIYSVENLLIHLLLPGTLHLLQQRLGLGCGLGAVEGGQAILPGGAAMRRTRRCD